VYSSATCHVDEVQIDGGEERVQYFALSSMEIKRAADF
jgi:hypothetical protein